MESQFSFSFLHAFLAKKNYDLMHQEVDLKWNRKPKQRKEKLLFLLVGNFTTNNYESKRHSSERKVNENAPKSSIKFIRWNSAGIYEILCDIYAPHFGPFTFIFLPLKTQREKSWNLFCNWL